MSQKNVIYAIYANGSFLACVITLVLATFKSDLLSKILLLIAGLLFFWGYIDYSNKINKNEEEKKIEVHTKVSMDAYDIGYKHGALFGNPDEPLSEDFKHERQILQLIKNGRTKKKNKKSS